MVSPGDGESSRIRKPAELHSLVSAGVDHHPGISLASRRSAVTPRLAVPLFPDRVALKVPTPGSKRNLPIGKFFLLARLQVSIISRTGN